VPALRAGYRQRLEWWSGASDDAHCSRNLQTYEENSHEPLIYMVICVLFLTAGTGLNAAVGLAQVTLTKMQ